MSALNGLSILVVDDDDDTRELFRLALLGSGGTIKVANSAESALAVLATWRPDVVLCDLHLPGVDGYGLLERVRADPALQAIPFISISASQPIERERSALAGFAKHLVKPSRISDIVAAVRSVGDAAL